MSPLSLIPRALLMVPPGKVPRFCMPFLASRETLERRSGRLSTRPPLSNC